MSRLFENDWLVLWGVLFILVVLIVVVGSKAKVDSTLVEGGKYKKPMLALEREPLIAKDWDEKTQEHVRKALRWDFLFLFIYPAAIAVFCFIVARALEGLRPSLFNIGLGIICLQLLTAAADATENTALLRILNGATQTPWPQIALFSTISKFALLGLGLLYVVVGGLSYLCLRYVCR